MEFEIKNRFSGDVQFTADIDCHEERPKSFKTGLAVKWAVEHDANLRSANLRSADLSYADLRYANLHSADLSSANLRSANLRSADLRYADLRSANLRSANLRSADLSSATGIADKVIDGGVRSDGYRVLLVLNDGVRRIQAGCRDFTVAEGLDHWESTRKDTPLGNETFAIIDHMERIADLREWSGK